MGVRREKVFFKAYVIALYLEEPTTDARVAIQTDEAKRVVITMLRDVGREMFVQAMEAGIRRNSAPAMPTLRARLDLLEQAIPDLTKGDVIDLTWVPGAGSDCDWRLRVRSLKAIGSADTHSPRNQRRDEWGTEEFGGGIGRRVLRRHPAL
jgi:hypothetical protein